MHVGLHLPAQGVRFDVEPIAATEPAAWSIFAQPRRRAHDGQPWKTNLLCPRTDIAAADCKQLAEEITGDHQTMP
jgi:hypothetical protein